MMGQYWYLLMNFIGKYQFLSLKLSIKNKIIKNYINAKVSICKIFLEANSNCFYNKPLTMNKFNIETFMNLRSFRE